MFTPINEQEKLQQVITKKVPQGDFSKFLCLADYFLASVSFTSSAGTISSLKV